jgi:hypothetical protein
MLICVSVRLLDGDSVFEVRIVDQGLGILVEYCGVWSGHVLCGRFLFANFIKILYGMVHTQLGVVW